MDLDRLMSKRRSIRKFKDQAISKENLELMLFSSTLAASPSNTQPVRFIQVSSLNKREKLKQAMENGRSSFLQLLKGRSDKKKVKNSIRTYWRFSEFMINAPLLMAVGTVQSTLSFSQRLLNAHIIDCDTRQNTDLDITVGLALQNFMLKAQELGIGTCILSAPMTFINSPEKVLGLEEADDIKIKCFLTAGYPDEDPINIKRKPINEIFKAI